MINVPESWDHTFRDACLAAIDKHLGTPAGDGNEEGGGAGDIDTKFRRLPKRLRELLELSIETIPANPQSQLV